MRAIIRERRVIQGLQSASGLERVGDFYFVIGDDACNLFRLDLDFNIVGTTRLFEINARDGERIAKMAKPDIEALCGVEWHGARELLCFGSGSKSPARDMCYRVDVTNPASPQNVRAVALTALYDALRANRNIVGANRLNVEAASCTHNTLSLFQRGNISGINARIEYDLRAFMQFLDAPSPLPVPRITTFALPEIQKRHAGFAAALTWHDSIFFAASVEDTDNEIDDGATLGSFIGEIVADELRWIAVVEQDSETAPVKIEGLGLLSAHDNSFRFVAVTDDDAGLSEILQIELTDR
jgi:hypothetical protein